MAVGSFPPCEFSSILTDQNSLFQSDQEIRLAEALVSVLQDAKSMHISVKTKLYKGNLQACRNLAKIYCSCKFDADQLGSIVHGLSTKLRYPHSQQVRPPF